MNTRMQPNIYCNGACTLDGHKAVISLNPDGFYIVKRLDGRGGDVEYSKQAIEYNMAKRGGNFKT